MFLKVKSIKRIGTDLAKYDLILELLKLENAQVQTKSLPPWCVGSLSLADPWKGIHGVVTNRRFQTCAYGVKELLNNTSAKCAQFYIMNFNQRILPCIIPTGYDNICIPSKILRHSPLFQFPLELASNCNVDRIQDVCDRPTFPSLWSLDISIFWQMTKGWRESIQREQSWSQGCFWSDMRAAKLQVLCARVSLQQIKMAIWSLPN